MIKFISDAIRESNEEITLACDKISKIKPSSPSDKCDLDSLARRLSDIQKWAMYCNPFEQQAAFYFAKDMCKAMTDISPENMSPEDVGHLHFFAAVSRHHAGRDAVSRAVMFYQLSNAASYLGQIMDEALDAIERGVPLEKRLRR